MSDQLNTEEKRQPYPGSPPEMKTTSQRRLHFLDQLDVSERAIKELSENELERIAAGGLGGPGKPGGIGGHGDFRKQLVVGCMTYVGLKATGWWDKRLYVPENIPGSAGKLPAVAGKV